MYIWFFFIRPDKTYEIKRSSFHPDIKMMQAIVRLSLSPTYGLFAAGAVFLSSEKLLTVFTSDKSMISFGGSTNEKQNKI